MFVLVGLPHVRADVRAPCDEYLTRPTIEWLVPPSPIERERFEAVVTNAGRLLSSARYDFRPRRVGVRFDPLLGATEGLFFRRSSELVLPVPTVESWWRTRAVWAHEYAHAVVVEALRLRGGPWRRFLEHIPNDPRPASAWYEPEYRRIARLLAVYDECFADLLAMLESKSPVVINRHALFEDLKRATDLPEHILREDPHYALMHFSLELYRRFDRANEPDWPRLVRGVIQALTTVVEGHVHAYDVSVDAARARRLFHWEIERQWALAFRP